MISGILLAAGEGRRFGSQKLLEPVDGAPMVSRVASVCLNSRLGELVVVTGPDGRVADELRNRFTGFCTTTRLRIVTNENPGRGLMSSLKVGLTALDAGATAAMVVHGDMPRLTPLIIDQLVIESSWHGGIIVAASGGEWRHPRVIPRSLFPDFLALDDDARGTEVIDRFRADVTAVQFDEPHAFIDIDEPGDLDTINPASKPRPS